MDDSELIRMRALATAAALTPQSASGRFHDRKFRTGGARVFNMNAKPAKGDNLKGVYKSQKERAWYGWKT